MIPQLPVCQVTSPPFISSFLLLTGLSAESSCHFRVVPSPLSNSISRDRLSYHRHPSANQAHSSGHGDHPLLGPIWALSLVLFLCIAWDILSFPSTQNWPIGESPRWRFLPQSQEFHLGAWVRVFDYAPMNSDLNFSLQPLVSFQVCCESQTGLSWSHTCCVLPSHSAAFLSTHGCPHIFTLLPFF